MIKRWSELKNLSIQDIWSLSREDVLKTNLRAIEQIMPALHIIIEPNNLWDNAEEGCSQLMMMLTNLSTIQHSDLRNWLVSMIACRYMECFHGENRGYNYEGYRPLGEYGLTRFDIRNGVTTVYVRDHEYFDQVEFNGSWICTNWLYHFKGYDYGYFANMPEINMSGLVNRIFDEQYYEDVSLSLGLRVIQTEGKIVCMSLLHVQVFSCNSQTNVGYGKGSFDYEKVVMDEELPIEYIGDLVL